MKAFLSCLLLGFMLTSIASGQPVSHSLSDDPTFARAVGKSIRYPDNARDQQLVAKVYVGFTVDEQGKIGQVKVLNFMDVDINFKQEVINALEKTPNREQGFAGNYILPISFQLEGKDGMKNPKDDDKQLVEKMDKQILLNEVFVIGYM